MISFQTAYDCTLNQIQPLSTELISISDAVGRVCAEDVIARVDSPSANVSLKDGYALRSGDIHLASAEVQIPLRVVGQATAGNPWPGTVLPGQAVRILSGAIVPSGADAVLAEEFTSINQDEVLACLHAEPGRNILRRGVDVQRGQVLASIGEVLSPCLTGLLAAAGYQQLSVIRRPRVGIIATGDEVVAPGTPLEPGKLYASNLITLSSWCRRYGYEVGAQIVRDEARYIRQALSDNFDKFDAILTSGGAWKGERDLVVRILDDLGWHKQYHRVRIGPGKAVGFGLLEMKPVFCLPGGPPSNLMAFLQLALPGLQRLAGWAHPGLPLMPVVMSETVSGQSDWTQFVFGRVELSESMMHFVPTWKQTSRLSAMAASNAVVSIPEGVAQLLAGDRVVAQWVT